MGSTTATTHQAAMTTHHLPYKEAIALLNNSTGKKIALHLSMDVRSAKVPAPANGRINAMMSVTKKQAIKFLESAYFSEARRDQFLVTISESAEGWLFIG